MALRTKKSVIFAKVESSYGVDPTPDATNDALQVFDFEPGPDRDTLERPEQGVSLGPLKELSGKARHNVSFTTELRGGGAAGTVPKGDSALFKACGLEETIVGGTSVTYAPRSESFESAAIYANLDGVRHAILGLVGNVEMILEAGEVGKLNWNLSARFVTPTDVSVPTTWTPNTTIPPVLKNLTIQLASFAAKVHRVSINLNNAVAERPDIGSAEGIAGFDIADRNVGGEIVIEALTLAEKNYWSSLTADTEIPFSVVVGSSAGNITTITISRIRLRNISWTDQDGIRTFTMPFQAVKTGDGENELSIAQT